MESTEAAHHNVKNLKTMGRIQSKKMAIIYKNKNMKRLTLVIMSMAMALATNVMGQVRMVTGQVTDETNSPMVGVNVLVKNTSNGTVADMNGEYSIKASGQDILVFSFIGYISEEINVGNKTVINVSLVPDNTALEEVVVAGYAVELKRDMTGAVTSAEPKSNGRKHKMSKAEVSSALSGQAAGVYNYGNSAPVYDQTYIQHNTEGYSTINENEFKKPQDAPLSTFSIDVDAASYSNLRRFINNGSRPPIDAVRIEEMINYFNYNYPQPQGEHPIELVTEISDCPWNENHRLIHVGLQGKKIPTDNLPASNLVFLIDVSGSMSDQNKLPLLKSSFKLLVDELRPEDRVSIVVYAGAAGMVLPSTSGKEKDKIVAALDRLQAGGSTAGGAGIQLAYSIAEENLVDGGNNRVILATDGDFNVGASSNAEMERLIEEKRNSGIFLTVLGYGMGNYKDDKMEILADKGNGNYAYIDNIQEAEKVLVNEFGGTLFTIAKDVKLQIEFNPEKVQAYRLVGYENRLLAEEDFNDDTKDAGELGSGHTVTALYEIIPVGVKSEFVKSIDPLKYQQQKSVTGATSNSEELMTIKFRYKDPEGSKSKMIEKAVVDHHTPLSRTSDNFRFSAAVAEYGMILRDSKFKHSADFDSVLELAENSKGSDKEGYRAEFVRLVKSSRFLAVR